MGKNRRLVAIMSVVLLLAVFVVSKCFEGAKEDGEIPVKKIEHKESETSNKDYDATIVIDAGHGGVDPGKVGVDGQLEKDINLSIALKLVKILEDEKDIHIKVIPTRTEDMGHYSENDKNKKMTDMKRRCEIANSSDADMVVSIHQNSYHSSSVKGAQVFFYRDSEGGKKLAEVLQENLIKSISDGKKGRVAKANDNYYLLLNVKCPAVIVECGFLSNSAEAALLGSDEYQEKIAGAIALGIKEYLIDKNK